MVQSEWYDLRNFLQHLEQKGELVRITEPVSVKHDTAAYIRKSSDTGGPAFLFENVKDYPNWTILGGLYSDRRRILEFFGCDAEKAVERFIAAIEHPIKPELVDDGPSQDIFIEGDDVNLYDIPITTNYEKDGPFIGAGIEVAKDPETGVRGLGIHRMELFEKNRLGIWAPNERRIGRARLKQEEKGEPLEIAVVIGADPITEQASVARVPHGVDKFDIAGGMYGEPVQLVRCKTIDLEVPAHAEMVLEGKILPDERRTESPYGEFVGVYGGREEVPVVEIQAITMRQDAIYQNVMTGIQVTEDHLLNWIPMCTVVYQDASRVAPEVQAVNVRGNHVFEAVVSIKKRLETEPWNVINTILAGASQAKYCMVVDEDIDVFNDKELNWAYSTRVQPHEDMHIYPVMVGAPLDPTAPITRQTSKLGIDATLGLDADRSHFEMTRVPGSDEVSW